MTLQFLSFQFPTLENVRCAFQVCSQGNSAWECGNISLDTGGDPEHVIQNRKDLLKSLDLPHFAEVHQVHGVRTLFQPPAQDPAVPANTDADGMATTEKKLGLLIKTADCQPILLAHRDGKHIAALHCGWKGNRQNYPALAVQEFCARYSLKPADIFAVRGPSLGPTAAEFVNFDKEWGSDFLPWFHAQTKTMDLWKLTEDQLVCAGVPRMQIFGIPVCTFRPTDSMTPRLFSYRRNPATGRQSSVIWME